MRYKLGKAKSRNLEQTFGLDQLDDPRVRADVRKPSARYLRRAKRLFDLFDQGRLPRELRVQLERLFDDRDSF